MIRHVGITFIPAPDDIPPFDPAYQSELRKVKESFLSQGVKVYVETNFGVVSGGGPDFFIQALQGLGSVGVGGILRGLASGQIWPQGASEDRQH